MHEPPFTRHAQALPIDPVMGVSFTRANEGAVELRIAGYQFPEASSEWDRNWLNIRLKIDTGQDRWEAEDPALLTWEVRAMIRWFEGLAAGKRPRYKHLAFTEPCLSLKLLDRSTEPLKRIRILFDMELRPHPPRPGQVYFVDLLADNAELQRIANELEQELARYPERTAAPY